MRNGVSTSLRTECVSICACVRVSVHSAKPSLGRSLSNMWTARPQEGQVGNVFFSLCLCVCSGCIHGAGWAGVGWGRVERLGVCHSS